MNVRRRAQAASSVWAFVAAAGLAACAGRSAPRPQYASNAEAPRGPSALPASSSPEGASPAPAPTEASASNAAPSDTSAATRRTLGWVIASVGAEAAIVAVTTSIMLIHEKSALNDNCNAQKACSQDGTSAAATIDSTVPWNTAAWIVAAAGLGAGAFLILTNPSDARQTAIGVSPTTGGAALGVRSRF